MKDLLFHAKATGSTMRNSGLRRFDQSWRLDAKRTAAPDQQRDVRTYRDEVILVGPHADPFRPAPMWRRRTPASPTRLWLDRLPDGKSQAARPARLPVRRKPTSASTSRC